MTVEILFPKLCNLYGDIKNMDYLRLCLPEAEFIETQITDKRPYFADHDVNLVYLGSMSEKSQARVVRWLEPYKTRIEAMIDAGTVFLATGNAMEVFADSIENLTYKETFPGLGLFPFNVRINLPQCPLTVWSGTDAMYIIGSYTSALVASVVFAGF